MYIGLILAQEAPEQNPYQTLIFLAIAAAFFYLILWRPEQKRRKKMNDMRASLKEGDKVTAMGVLGTVETIHAETFILKNVDGSKLEMMKGAITEVHQAKEPTPAEEDKSSEGA